MPSTVGLTQKPASKTKMDWRCFYVNSLQPVDSEATRTIVPKKSLEPPTQITLVTYIPTPENPKS